MKRRSNPFSVCFVQPGSIPYRPFDGTTVESMIERLNDRLGGWGAIVGPHGSGKSTLLAHIVSLVRPNREVAEFRFTTSQRVFPGLLTLGRRWPKGALIAVDGYEQLNLFQRSLLRLVCSWCGFGLLVTAHRKVWGLATLWETFAEDHQATYVMGWLLRDDPELLHQINAGGIWDKILKKHQHDVREALMEMYDWYEDKKRSTGPR